MMTTKRILLLAGAAVILTGIIAASVFITNGEHSEENGSQEVTTERKEETDDERANGAGGPEREMDQKVIEVHGLGHLYYLDPEGDQTFQRRLTHFVSDQGIKAGSADVLEYCIDDREKETELAQFFLELDDEDHTIVRVSFEKPTGTYRFNLYDGSIPDDPDGEAMSKDGREEETIPESTEDEIVRESRLTITDLEGELKAAARMKELKKHLRRFLRSEGEGRRNFYVSSVTMTEDGYTALLCFETVRQDGRNVEVIYDGEYHFHFV